MVSLIVNQATPLRTEPRARHAETIFAPVAAPLRFLPHRCPPGGVYIVNTCGRGGRRTPELRTARHVESDRSNSVLGDGMEEGIPKAGVPDGFTASTPRHLLMDFRSASDSVVVLWDPDGERLFAAPLRPGQPLEWVQAIRSTSPEKQASTAYTFEVPVRVSDSLAQGTIQKAVVELRPFRDGSRVLFRMNDYRTGTIELGGKSYRVGLLRSGNQLSFTDPDAMRVVLDLDGDGSFQMGAGADSSGVWHESESFDANRPIVVEGQAFVIAQIDPDGRSFILRPSQQQEAFVVGLPAPDLSLQTLSGDSLRLSDLRGRFVVLNWWATGCGPCIAEMPGLNELVAQYDSADVAFVAIADNEPSELETFFKDRSFDYVQTLASDTVRAHLGSSWPKHIMLDEEGRVVYFETGGSANRHEDLDQAIRALMQTS